MWLLAGVLLLPRGARPRLERAAAQAFHRPVTLAKRVLAGLLENGKADLERVFQTREGRVQGAAAGFTLR